MSGKRRLDELLVDRGLAESRTKAQALILAGLVFDRDGRRLDKAGKALPDDAEIEVKGKDHPWVSRGGVKLAHGLDRFAIDFSLCMYCGICVEVCPFDALFWSPEFEYSEPNIADMLHDKTKLSEWMETVPEAPELEAGADRKKK